MLHAAWSESAHKGLASSSCCQVLSCRGCLEQLMPEYMRNVKEQSLQEVSTFASRCALCQGRFTSMTTRAHSSEPLPNHCHHHEYDAHITRCASICECPTATNTFHPISVLPRKADCGELRIHHAEFGVEQLQETFVAVIYRCSLDYLSAHHYRFVNLRAHHCGVR